jgi:hypothetical protein
MSFVTGILEKMADGWRAPSHHGAVCQNEAVDHAMPLTVSLAADNRERREAGKH